VGNFGSTDRVDYTALGENVNLASRLEGLNKVLGTSCLISRATQDELGERLVTRRLGAFQLKGFDKTVEVYELVGHPEQADASRLWREAFASALTAFEEFRVEEASAGFERVLQLRPGDGPAQFYAARMQELQSQPRDKWTPFTVVKEK
jgi:adenylate cyclase